MAPKEGERRRNIAGTLTKALLWEIDVLVVEVFASLLSSLPLFPLLPPVPYVYTVNGGSRRLLGVSLSEALFNWYL